jgi:hypothetical protein
MAENTAQENSLAATVAASDAAQEFEQTEFDAEVKGRKLTFISIPHKIVEKQGSTKTERVRAFFVPKESTLEGKLGFASWLLGQHDETEKDSGTKVADKLLFRLLEAANEKFITDSGEYDPNAYVDAMLKPTSRSGTGVGAIKKKLGEESLKVTELFLITREKDKDVQAKMIAAAGKTSIGQVLAELDTVTQRTIELTRQLAARQADQAKREEKKLKKAQEVLAEAQKAAQATPQAA